MKKYVFIITFILSGFAFLFNSCEQKDDNLPEVEVAEDDALTTLVFEDVYSEVEDALSTMESVIYHNGKKSATEVTCKTVTIEHPDDSTFWPRTVTVDYGDGCTGPNGRMRSGKIIIVVNKPYLDSTHYRTVTFEDYYVDGYHVEGQKNIVNEGLNEANNYVFSVSLVGGKVTSPDGQVMTREFSRQREWVAGSDTPGYRMDDEYMITGVAEGINRKGLTYSRTILTPLHVSLSCPWIMSGSVEIQAEERETAVLDYGDGTCDRFATVTVGDQTRTIRLHR